MKAAIIAVLALSAISVAVAVTVNAYTDAACNTLGSNPILGLANPSVVPLNTCSKSYTVSGQQLYTKFTACTSTAATSQTYTDSACSTCIGGGACVPSIDVPDKCTVLDLSGVGSFKISCSSASTATITFVSVVAAALAVSL
jgi:hypothetical protein